MQRKAKIVATLGPSSRDDETVRKLIKAGLDVARLNFSHGTHAEHKELIDRIRKLSQETGRSISILQDLQGPKLRVGVLPKDGVRLTAGQRVVLTSIEEGEEPVFEGQFEQVPLVERFGDADRITVLVASPLRGGDGPRDREVLIESVKRTREAEQPDIIDRIVAIGQVGLRHASLA